MNMNVNRLNMVLLLSVMTPSLAFATNGYFAHGYGTKNKGLAGAGSAMPGDALSAATNPAGMVTLGERVDVGLAAFSPSPRSYSATANNPSFPDNTPCSASPQGCPFTIGGDSTAVSIESENDIFYIPSFAYNWSLNDRSSIGVSVYGNGGMNTEYVGGNAQHSNGQDPAAAVTTPGTFGAGTAGINLEQLFIATTYAMKLGKKSSVGVSAILAFQSFEAKGLATFGGFSTSSNNLTNNGVDNASGKGLKLGIQSEVLNDLTLAASYQSKMDMSKFDKYAGLFAEQGDFDIPSTWTLGLAWTPGRTIAVVFDVQKINYSEVPAIANPMSYLIGPSNSCATQTNLNRCLGGSEGAGFGWQDMTIYKLGMQIVGSPNMIWRMGYSHGDQPIPESEVVFNILAPAVIEDHLTLGFTRKVLQSSEINFQYMHGFSNSVTGANPLNPGQQITLEMVQNELELSWGTRF